MNLFEGVRLNVSQSLESKYALLCIDQSKKKLFLLVQLILIHLLFFSCEEKTEFETHNKILFTSEQSGKKQLYTMNPDGTDIEQITSGEYWHSNGRWSPDAERIVCNTEEGTTTAGTEMVVMNSDGSDRTLLGWGSQMSWAPDGNKIAYIYLPSAELGLKFRFIYTIYDDGSNPKRISNDSLELIYSPCWSHNGDKIYFTSNRHDVENSKTNEIYYMDNDGNNITRLTYTQDGSSYSASISPSGDRIVFMSTSDNASKGSIYLSDINCNTKTLIISPPDTEIYNYPKWSPDEEYIIFVGVSTDGNGKSSVYKIWIDGKCLIKFIKDAYSADWSS